MRVPFYPPLWADPARDPTGEKPEHAWERLKAPRDVQQSFVAAGLALVHRWDLITLMHELIWRRAQVDSLRSQAYVPGLLKCAKCSLVVAHVAMDATSGLTGPDCAAQQCLNGCGPMWRVGEREVRQETQVREDRYFEALLKIAEGDGCYGAQALEYKNLARQALCREQVGGAP